MRTRNARQNMKRLPSLFYACMNTKKGRVKFSYFGINTESMA
jgi:hypothetical protein